MTEQELHDFYYDDLEWCGCGETSVALRFLGDVLQAIDTRYEDKESDERYRVPLELLGMEHNPGMAYAYLYWMDAHDLTEHGSTIRACWLTEKGKAVMEAIRTYDVEYILSMEFAMRPEGER